MRYLYLHGFASSPASGKATYFKERFAARGIDLAVPALDSGNFERLTISSQLRIMERELGGAPAVLIGSSMGGYLAAVYAERHPEVYRVVLMAPAFGLARRWPDALGDDVIRQWREQGWRMTYHYAHNREERIGYQLLEDGLQYEDQPDVRQPALIFHGLHDDVVPPSFSEEFAATRPNVRLRLLDSDHALSDQLPLMWRESEEFLFC